MPGRAIQTLARQRRPRRQPSYVGRSPRPFETGQPWWMRSTRTSLARDSTVGRHPRHGDLGEHVPGQDTGLHGDPNEPPRFCYSADAYNTWTFAPSPEGGVAVSGAL